MKKITTIILTICLVNLANSQYVFEKLKPESGTEKSFYNSNGITTKGKVFTTNELFGGMSQLAFGLNGTNRTPFIQFDSFKELRKNKKRIGYKFKAHNVGANYSPLGLQSSYDVYFLIKQYDETFYYAYTTVTNSMVRQYE